MVQRRDRTAGGLIMPTCHICEREMALNKHHEWGNGEIHPRWECECGHWYYFTEPTFDKPHVISQRVPVSDPSMETSEL